MYRIALFEQIENLLWQKANAAHIEDLQKYYIPESQYKKQSFYFRLASSLQNGTSSGMDKSIRFNGENRDTICDVLCDCNYNEVLKKYKSEEALYEAFTERIRDRGAESRQKRASKDTLSPEEKDAIQKRKTNWEKYARGLYQGAQFLHDDETKGILNQLLSYNHRDELDMKNIKSLLGKIKITGLGTPLCCDWLKECGCHWLVKPDIHIKLVYEAMKEKETGEALSKINDYDVIAYYFDWVKLLNQNGKDVTVYQLDKMIWLICTGEFYLDKDERIGRNTIIESIQKST